MTTKELSVIGRAELTQERATYLLKTFWPGAPDEAILKASLLAATYKLDPILKEVMLVPIQGKNGTDWVIFRDIKAKRKMAAKRIAPHRYSYADDTPRVMTDEEQKKILGAVDPDRIWGIVKLKVGTDIYPGYGNWPKSQIAYGTDKGNSQRNMAFIRAESNALEKMAPGDDEGIEDFDPSCPPLGEIASAALEQGRADAEAVAEKDQMDLFGPKG